MKKLILAGLALLGAACMTCQAQTKPDTAAAKAVKVKMTKVEAADVPAPIAAALKGPDYAGWAVASVYTNPEKNRYSVLVTKGTEKKKLWFDDKGTFIPNKKKS